MKAKGGAVLLVLIRTTCSPLRSLLRVRAEICIALMKKFGIMTLIMMKAERWKGFMERCGSHGLKVI